MDVAAWRRETRARMIQLRELMPAEEHQLASSKIEAALVDILSKLPAQTIGCYWPYKSEIDLRALMARLRDVGWTTALPNVVKKGQPLEFLKWTSDADLDPGVYGIPVPRVRELVRPAVVIAPLVAFDANNYRLGYGAGYFDITLATLDPRPSAIGVGFELSRVDTIHPHENDIPMDIVITESVIHHRATAD
jgi:5-formyltetrahydrofolate cyclo-ligase